MDPRSVTAERKERRAQPEAWRPQSQAEVGLGPWPFFKSCLVTACLALAPPLGFARRPVASGGVFVFPSLGFRPPALARVLVRGLQCGVGLVARVGIATFSHTPPAYPAQRLTVSRCQ